jgi:alpha-galactosidase/6-phospho-beta-glucosidase family protein
VTKIAFIGAGSLGFTRGLVRDILTFPLLKDSTLALMDIDAERLDFAHRSVQRIVDMGNYPARVEATMDRVEALKGADVVLCTILAGGTDVWRYDIEIPKKYGVDTNIGDTRGPSGIFRALRTIPVMLDIVRDMERYCPDATLLNYTNPIVHPVDGAVSQRAGHGHDAGRVDRRADGRDHLHLRGHQPPGVVPRVPVERQGRLSADPRGHQKARDL